MQELLVAAQGLPVTRECCGRVLALPMHPYLDAETQDRIIGAVVEAVRLG